MRSRCLSVSVLLLHPLCFSVLPSFSQTWAYVPHGMGEEHEHHGKGGCPWAWSALRCRAVSTWSRSNSSKLSHGQTQTKAVDKNVMLWHLPLQMDKHLLDGFSRWTAALLLCFQGWSSSWPWTTGRKRIHGETISSHPASGGNTFIINPLRQGLMHLQLPWALF